MRVCVSGRSDMPRRIDLARTVIDAWTKVSGEAPMVSTGLARVLGLDEGVDVEGLQTDVIITVGGDGTILWTLMHNQAPILGVNDGQLGFLTETPPDRVRRDLERLERGDYFIENRGKVAVSLNGEFLGTCTNECVVKTPRPSKILTFDVYAGDHRIESVRADGLIVATPTGSTSYAMSAGGPLVDPDLEALIVVPLAPFRVALRPIVLPGGHTLTIRLAEKEKEAIMALDGQVEHPMLAGDEVTLTQADERARFVRFTPHFLARLSDLFG